MRKAGSPTVRQGALQARPSRSQDRPHRAERQAAEELWHIRRTYRCLLRRAKGRQGDHDQHVPERNWQL